MRVLFCSLQHSYGRPEWGLSHEYVNLYDALAHMSGVEADFFGLDEALRPEQRDAVNKRLIRLVQETKPDVLFCQLFTEELKKETIRFITRQTTTKTINWFGDDHWRFHIFSKLWAPYFTAVCTTDPTAIPLYQKLGVTAVATQWGVNQHRYYPAPAGLDPEVASSVTFVGQKYGIRGRYYEDLRRAALPVRFFGSGWPAGTIDFERMRSVFSTSAVNLNFTESPHGQFAQRLKLLSRFVVRRELGRWRLNVHRFRDTARALPGYQRRQIKARIFEILGCGGFLITGDAEGLGAYYEPGVEMAVFKTGAELAEQCQYYLNHPELRDRIARAGYERTLREHTYEQRFRAIFSAVMH